MSPASVGGDVRPDHELRPDMKAGTSLPTHHYDYLRKEGRRCGGALERHRSGRAICLPKQHLPSIDNKHAMAGFITFFVKFFVLTFVSSRRLTPRVFWPN